MANRLGPPRLTPRTWFWQEHRWSGGRTARRAKPTLLPLPGLRAASGASRAGPAPQPELALPRRRESPVKEASSPWRYDGLLRSADGLSAGMDALESRGMRCPAILRFVTQSLLTRRAGGFIGAKVASGSRGAPFRYRRAGPANYRTDHEQDFASRPAVFLSTDKTAYRQKVFIRAERDEKGASRRTCSPPRPAAFL